MLLATKRTHTLTILFVIIGSMAHSEACFAPDRPFVPTDPEAAKEYAELIRGDFETYISDVQAYFRCLEEERARAFHEAHEVSQEYGQFVQLIGQ